MKSWYGHRYYWKHIYAFFFILSLKKDITTFFIGIQNNNQALVFKIIIILRMQGLQHVCRQAFSSRAIVLVSRQTYLVDAQGLIRQRSWAVPLCWSPGRRTWRTCKGWSGKQSWAVPLCWSTGRCTWWTRKGWSGKRSWAVPLCWSPGRCTWWTRKGWSGKLSWAVPLCWSPDRCTWWMGIWLWWNFVQCLLNEFADLALKDSEERVWIWEIHTHLKYA